MARQYRVLFYSTIVLAVFFAASFTKVLAADDPFTVAGVKVDATAGNAVDARKKAFDQAQQSAFTALAQRFLSPEQMKNFHPPAADQITPLVDDFELTNEQLSAVRYIGTYTFRFKRAASRAAISAKAGPLTEPSVAAAAQPAAPPTDGPASTPEVAATPHSTSGPSLADAPYSPANFHSDPAITSAMSGAMAANGLPFNGVSGNDMSGAATYARLHFNSAREWVQMQRSLRRVPGIGAVTPESLTPVDAVVAIHYPGGESALRQALGQSGFSLSQTGTADYGATDNGGPLIYDLTSSNSMVVR